MTLAVTADAALLAVPNFANSAGEAEAIIQRVLHWSSLATKGAVKLYQLSGTIDALTLGGYFPSGPNVKALLELFHLDHVYSSEDVRKSINTILDRATSLVDVIGLEVTRFSNEHTHPDLTPFKSDAPLYGACLCGISTIVSRKIHKHPCNLLISGMMLPAAPLHTRCQVDEIISAQQDINVPFSVTGVTRLVHSLDDLVEEIGADMIWELATDEVQLHLAISAKASELLKASGQVGRLKDVPQFGIGGEFYKSLIAWKAANNGPHASVVLETCARLVLGDPKYEVADMRSKKRRTSPIIKRKNDSASAKRTHVTKGHEGLRLMFWKLPNKPIELANLGSKNELVILTGAAQRTIMMQWD